MDAPSDATLDPLGATSSSDDDSAFAALLQEVAHADSLPLEALDRPEARRPIPGDLLDDQFEIVRCIGEGGMGVVFAARDLRLGRLVAVKLLKLDGRGLREREALLRAFERDGAATARLRHPNVITLYHLGQWQGAPFLVLELLEGQELAELIQHRRLTLPELLDIAAQIARALEHAHAAGVVHRDLKPRNIVLLPDGQLKVLDFGLAALTAPQDIDPDAHDPTRRAGTPAYMAPEQWRGQPQDARCDLFAFGVLLYQLVCGDLPWTNARDLLDADQPPPPPSAHPHALTDLLDTLIQSALQPDLAKRLTSATEARRALETLEARLNTPDLARAPFRYLEAFTEDDAPWFFGRDRDAARLLALTEARPLVAVVAPSGAGKTSLVAAGLAARLHQRDMTHRVIRLRPGTRPLDALWSALQPFAADALLPLAPEPHHLLHAPGHAAHALRLSAQQQSVRVWLLVDQLEELYTRGASDAERAAFAQALCAAADDPHGPLRVVVTLREDHLYQLAEHPELRDKITSALLPLGPPEPDALRDALLRPLARLNYQLEPGLADTLLDALRDEPVPLPLLQLAASHLWERRDHATRRLDAAVLDQLGGVAGILAAHADAALKALPTQSDLDAARRILCRLVSPDGARQSTPTNTLLRDDPDPEAARRVIQHLTDARLLTAARSLDGDLTLEIAHDALLARWTRLRRWLEDSRDERLLRKRLHDATRHWETAGRPPGLLWRDHTLDDALHRALPLAISHQERAFLRHADHLQRRSRRRRRALLTATLLAALLIAAASALAVAAIDTQRRRAEQGEADARAEQLRAEHARHEAERLAEAMLFDLSRELEPLGRLDLLERIASDVNRYLDTTPSPPGDARALRQRAATSRILGELAQTRGDLPHAERLYLQSLRSLEALNHLTPHEPDAQRELATALRHLGNAQAERGDFPQARALFLRARDHLTPPSARGDAPPRLLEELARDHYALGNVDLELRRLDDAADHYADGQRLYQRLHAREPLEADWRRGVAAGAEKLGDVERRRGRYDRAEALYRSALDDAQKLADADPRDIYGKRDLAVLYERLGDVCMALQRFDESRNLHAQSLAIIQLLTTLAPDNADWQSDLAVSYEKIGDADEALNHLPDALARYQDSLVITKRLASDNPRSAAWLRDLAITHERIAQLLLKLQRGAEADSHLDRALDLRRKLVAESPRHEPWRAELQRLLQTRAQRANSEADDLTSPP